MRRYSRASFTTAEQAVAGEINTTPLIDVMLVLLIICITSMPLMNHKVSIQLPGKPGVSPPVHRLWLDAHGGLSLNGARTSLASLPAQLELIQRDPRSQLEFRTDGAVSYNDFDRTLAVVKKAGVRDVAFPDNHAFVTSLDP